MARNLISKLGPETHRVLAAALVHERAFGNPMSESVLRRLCEAEGASLGACLAVILGHGLDRGTGKPVPLDGPWSSLSVPDDETEAALDWREKIDPS